MKNSKKEKESGIAIKLMIIACILVNIYGIIAVLTVDKL